jgi:hypothetical protein
MQRSMHLPASVVLWRQSTSAGGRNCRVWPVADDARTISTHDISSLHASIDVRGYNVIDIDGLVVCHWRISKAPNDSWSETSRMALIEPGLQL